MVNKKLKRFEEKHALLLAFVVLAVLVLGSMFVMDNPSMTGNVIIEGYNLTECVETGYTWEDITNETCTDIVDCVVCELDCLEDCTECVDEVIGQQCSNLTFLTEGDCGTANYTWEDITNETCTDIVDCVVCELDCLEDCTECVDEVIGGQCTGDVCGDGILEGSEECDDTNIIDGDGCSAICLIECVPETCASLSYDCDDISDGCGGTLSCGACDAGYSCDDGECEEDVEEDTTSGVTGAVVEDTDKTQWGSTCVSNWECGEWSECVGGTQTRECTDTYNCVTPTENLNPMSLSCTGPETIAETIAEETLEAETCFDGMMNQDEKGIDCGGACEQRCSFFTIMGDAVNVPINSSKEFVQNNKAISFSILGVIVLAVSWIVCVKVFLKKKNMFFFLENVDWSKCRRGVSSCLNVFKRKK
jgi:cysteine-rich repeat protein